MLFMKRKILVELMIANLPILIFDDSEFENQ